MEEWYKHQVVRIEIEDKMKKRKATIFKGSINEKSTSEKR